MTMREIILNFPKQFAFKPEIQNTSKLKKQFKKFVICGMGGSNLVHSLIKIWNPKISIENYRDYGLPSLSEADFKKTLIIVNSYSGNTAEVLDNFLECLKNRVSVLAISTGGKLLEFAKNNKVPYIELPEVGIEPRFSLGYQIKAVLTVLGEVNALEEVSRLTHSLNPGKYEIDGKKLALKIKGSIPIIYSSVKNKGIIYNWKIKFNESSKTAAFFNVFPELNHNEMVGFLDSKAQLGLNFHFLLLRDSSDRLEIKKRMEIMAKLFMEKSFRVDFLDLEGGSVWFKIFSSLILADWTSFYLAKEYGVDPLDVDMIEEFKSHV